jgi:PAS domain S-box-containing protein
MTSRSPLAELDPTAALLESEERFRTMANGAPVLLWMADTSALCVFFNQFWLEFTGRTQEQEYGNGWAEGVHAEDFQGCMTTYMNAFVARRSFSMEYRMRRADGEYRWIYDQGVPRFTPDGTFAGYIGSCIDITDRRNAQEAMRRLNHELQQRIHEREVMLREIHHRVKNNLQLISSLLSMQVRQLGEGPSRSAIEECHSRVQSIAMIHEDLYQSDDLAHIRFGSYGRTLATNAFHATGVSPISIALEVELADVLLPVHHAIPCGLILNELITNAVKHAFPGGRSGTIRVVLARQPAGRLQLSVSDDGVGLPAELDPLTTESLGLQIVVTMAEQIEADLRIERDTGLGFHFTFDTPAVASDHAV